ncbi:WD40-repeat-containing domain protein [Clohesyomyces aquaticus]|uniref:WD40-repeat-containing domain protein n=1 Tax=Clohesyomyces aquaticus TaxID=1231657 RepID=A0A1Y1YIK0_9PLEO|nr:WD40-repeat-containing domain protein [Clohesyomyces aquaticus]
MKTEFQFSNLLGTVYGKGNLLFTPDGTCLLSPVGNRVSIFDLVNSKSYTLPFAHRRNIARLALNPRGNLLLSVDEDGRAILTNVPRRIALYHFSFRGEVSALAFAPSGRHFAAGIGRQIEVWHTPSTPDVADGDLEFAPFVRHRIYTGHFDNVRSIEWSTDSRFFLSASKDLTARIWSMDPEEGFVPTTLGGHRQGVVGAWFSKDQETIYTVSKDGALFVWKYVLRPDAPPDATDNDENWQWRIADRHYFVQSNAHVTCAAFHPESKLLVAGFSNGIFTIHELPEFSQIQNLSISQNDIDFVAMNKTGEWLAFGASKLGQLLVWEWQSESYILKQQGHFDSMNAIAHSPDGQRVITAADDGKIKVWDVNSGFCVVTFTEHISGVTACEFAKRGNVLFTASLDGSIRAWDLIRYRNFRTFTAPSRLSFSSLAVDPSGEVVCAGSIDSFDIHIWSVQTGQLLDRLSGHEGPVSSLAFAPDGGTLVSGSWDHTVRVWNIFARTQTSEPLQLMADILCVAFRPDSKQIAVTTLDGQLTFWSVSEASQQGGIDAQRDVSGGRKMTDRRTAANVAGTKSFTCIRYSADGSCVLAGGNSKYICLYDAQSGVLVKKFTVSVNLSLDGTQEFLNSRLLTDAGPQGLIDDQGEASDPEDRRDNTLPGAQRGDAARKTRPEIRVPAVGFSPTGRAFCAASTEGLLIYSLDTGFQFDPFDLDVTVTPASTLATLAQKDYLKALVMAFRLNERNLIRRVYEGIPVEDIQLVVKDIPTVYLGRLLRFVAVQADESPHLEFNLRWIEGILSKHGRWLKDNRGLVESEVRQVEKCVRRIQNELARLVDENVYRIEYLLGQPREVEKGEEVRRLAFEVDGEGDVGEMEGVQGGEEEDDEDEWMGIE